MVFWLLNAMQMNALDAERKFPPHDTLLQFVADLFFWIPLFPRVTDGGLAFLIRYPSVHEYGRFVVHTVFSAFKYE